MIYKCCLCKKNIRNAYFHHFTDRMKPRYQCIKCRFVTPEGIAWAREYSKKLKKQLKFLKQLSGPNGGKFAERYLKKCAKNSTKH